VLPASAGGSPLHGTCGTNQASNLARGLARRREPCSNDAMRPLARLSIVGMVGLGLGSASTALGQRDSKPPAASPPNVSPAHTTVASIPTPSGESSAGSVQASSRKDSAQPPTTPNSDPLRPVERDPWPARDLDAGTTSNSDASKPVGGGYSWSDRKARPRKARGPAGIDPKRPLVEAPNFALRPDGSSVVTLLLSQPTQVIRAIQGSRFEYHLKAAQIGVSNNMNPLITAHFATPLERVELHRSKNDAILTLELRENVQPTHQIRSGPSGTTVLEVTLPKPSRDYLQPKSSPQVQQPTPRAARSDRGPKRRHRTAQGPDAKSGPGPRL
jgi:hypothetical protein